jgi:very-short-patch-repair endonuclease
LIEIEGGAWGGRHTRGFGFTQDCEKYLEATLMGWTVIRLSANLITTENLERIRDEIKKRICP